MTLDKFTLARDELEKICTYCPDRECYMVFCILHSAEYLGDHEGKSHPCIACNLNDGLAKIYKFLDENKKPVDIEYSFTIYILLCYLLVEKMHTIFRYIGISYEYVEEKWWVLIEIRKWANFIKHPKGFLFSHHSEYFYENEKITKDFINCKQINYDNFIKPLYSSENPKKFKQTINEFANKDDLLVIIPCPERIAKELNVACNEFCKKIKDNEHFKEILKKDSVLEKYYEDELIDDESSD